MTYPWIHILENHLEPVETLANVGLHGSGDSNGHGEHDDRRKSGQVGGRYVDEKVVKQVSLLVRLEPLESLVLVGTSNIYGSDRNKP
jgi:hypothetical protein